MRHNYRKHKQRKEKSTILIICDGNTEKIYFQQLKRYERSPNYKITLDCIGNEDLWNVLVYINRKYFKGTKDKKIFNIIFIVIDLDIVYQDKNLLEKFHKLQEDISKEKNIHLITSMPCFEIWLLLHFDSASLPYSCQDVIKRLCRFIQYYKKNKDWLERSEIYSQLKPHMKDAILNARSLDTKKDPFSPHTLVYKIIEFLGCVPSPINEASDV